ncbi:MAG TPA: 4-hydroxy-3-methylbut-2-enyl diphosphate reductase, partial [Candidatus Tenderia sp.]|nr:4-hydroxy-3-methylbut-2-enyl diphosphate reductase [Candidatus Tenderia sp.]
VHMEVVRHQQAGHEVILIGHAGHPEVEGTLGQYEGNGMYLVETPDDVMRLKVRDSDRLAFVTQTTLSLDDTALVIDALRARFPAIVGPKKNDICYATQNRQDAVKALARNCDLVLVVGSANSSNSNRLRELAERLGSDAYLIDNASQIRPAWLVGRSAVGVTAGASAPEVLVDEVIERLRTLGCEEVVNAEGREETVTFSLPRELRLSGESGG